MDRFWKASEVSLCSCCGLLNSGGGGLVVPDPPGFSFLWHRIFEWVAADRETFKPSLEHAVPLLRDGEEGGLSFRIKKVARPTLQTTKWHFTMA